MESLTTTCASGVLTLTLNRPAALNSIDVELGIGLADALEKAQSDSSIAVIVITGAGERAFCAGADLKTVASGTRIDGPFGFAGVVRHPIDKPLIAAVNGLALGGGFEIALACDLVIAGETASFGVPEVSLGAYPSGGATFRLPDQLPRKVAMELLLTGDPISATRGYELGFVNRVTAPESLLETALSIAARIQRNAPLAVRAIKRLSSGRLGRPGAGFDGDDTNWLRVEEEGAALMQTRDAREGIAAFVGRRRPSWEGR